VLVSNNSVHLILDAVRISLTNSMMMIIIFNFF